jgi:hypothetical protein
MIKLKSLLEDFSSNIPDTVQNPVPIPPVPSTPTMPMQYANPVKKKLSFEDKKALAEMVGKFNEYGQVLHNYENITKMAEDLLRISELAESYAINESGDWFDEGIIKKDMGDIKKMAGDINKSAKECYARNKQMQSQFENMGHRLSRYFKIAD